MRIAARPLFLLTTLLLASCDRPAIDPSQSLVGAKQLPSPDELSQETIIITKDGGPLGEDTLTYEWEPNYSVTVAHKRPLRKNFEKIVKGEDFLRLSPEVAAAARRRLWRLRPEKLEGVDKETRPFGCRRQGPHDFPEMLVAFVSDRGTVAIEDDQIGIFALPYASSCNSPTAIQARQLLAKILKSFPHSKVVADFENLDDPEPQNS